jgi:hypothetical protein
MTRTTIIRSFFGVFSQSSAMRNRLAAITMNTVDNKNIKKEIKNAKKKFTPVFLFLGG